MASKGRGTLAAQAALVALLAASGALPARAGGLAAWIPDGFFYLGAGAGYQRSDPKLTRFSPVPVPCAPRDCVESVDDDAISWSLFGGYQLNRYVAVEAAFTKLPDSYKVRIVDPNFPQPALLSVDQDSEAVTLRGVFTLPMREVSAHPLMDPVSLSAVVGISHWRSDSRFVVDATGVAGGSFNSVDNTQHGNDLVVGARVNYDVTEQVRVSGAWDHYRELGRSPVAAPRTVPPLTVQSVSSPVDVFSLNVSYRFR